MTLDLGVDVWKVVQDIVRVGAWLIGKVIQGFNWGHARFVDAGGEPAGLLYIIIWVVMIPFIIAMWTISGAQESMENLQKFISALALRGIAVGIIVFVILFLLGG